MTIPRFILFAAVLANLVLIVGCGSPDTRATVSGTITYDGEPVQTGVVAFEPTGETAPPHTASITDGAYELRLEPGKYLVRISASDTSKQEQSAKDVAPPPEAEGREGLLPDLSEEEYSPLLPPAWNTQSTLTVDVAPGENTVNFRGEKDGEPTVQAQESGV